jgi:hypothetical protein
MKCALSNVECERCPPKLKARCTVNILVEKLADIIDMETDHDSEEFGFITA